MLADVGSSGFLTSNYNILEIMCLKKCLYFAELNHVLVLTIEDISWRDDIWTFRYIGLIGKLQLFPRFQRVEDWVLFCLTRLSGFLTRLKQVP